MRRNTSAEQGDQSAVRSSWDRKTDGETSEREPFLGVSSSASSGVVAGPVKLTPGWEDSPQSGDDFDSLGTPPKDRFNIVYIILIIHGIGTLMPWNMFITAKPYFVDYKLNANYTGSNSTQYYADNFLQYLGLAAQIPNVFFNWLNVFVQLGGNLKTRIVWSIVVEVVLFVITVILAMVDTSAIPGFFFYATMLTVVAINMAGGIYQNSIYGIAAKLDYAGAVVLGSNISGTFISVISIISIWLAPSTRTAAIYYFITALFVLLCCFDSYFALPLNKFYRYHEMTSAKEQENKQRQSVPKTSYMTVLKKCLPQCINVFFVFFVTLSIFPAMHSDVYMVDPNFFLTKKYFAPVTCFLTFNFFAMVGNMIPSLIEWPSPKYLWIPVFLRVLFIPFYMLCNYQPQGYERIFFPDFHFDDWTYWAGAVFMGLTSGYYSSLAMIYCGRSVPNDEAPIAGMFGASFLITGIFVGINTAFVIPWFVSTVSLGS